MAAIITDQMRILNAENFVSGVQSSTNSYYTFIGLPNAPEFSSTWDQDPPSPKDSYSNFNDNYDTMFALKKINASDVSRVIRKTIWTSGITYDMWRDDITRDNPSLPSGAFDIYSANYFVMNSDYRVYVCISNNANPENNFQGSPSLDEPKFVDLEPRAAGTSGDGYIWKYLYTIKTNDAVKFESTTYMPVPNDWTTNNDVASVRDNAATSGQIKMITIRDRGVQVGTANVTYTGVPIKGDGRGATATITINNNSKVETITVSNGGSGYTYGTVDLVAGGVPSGSTNPSFNVIIPPSGGHGANVYTELGAFNVLTYSRFENDTDNPDFITGNQFARIGLIANPKAYGSTTNLTVDKASALYALKLTGVGYSAATFVADSFVTQTVGVGSTAVGRVVSYDPASGVLKLWQDRTNSGFNFNGSLNINPTFGFETIRFTSDPTTGGSVNIVPSTGNTLAIQTSFTGVSTVINNRTYYLGQSFTNGVSQPEVEKYSGRMIYVDNRPSVTRSSAQKEDVKIIVQF
tara:strand:- start:1555 stop:3114 length:1560 start_codon:yes stop_codon:yes gene_type:complete